MTCRVLTRKKLFHRPFTSSPSAAGSPYHSADPVHLTLPALSGTRTPVIPITQYAIMLLGIVARRCVALDAFLHNTGRALPICTAGLVQLPLTVRLTSITSSVARRPGRPLRQGAILWRCWGASSSDHQLCWTVQTASCRHLLHLPASKTLRLRFLSTVGPERPCRQLAVRSAAWQQVARHSLKQTSNAHFATMSGFLINPTQSGVAALATTGAAACPLPPWTELARLRLSSTSTGPRQLRGAFAWSTCCSGLLDNGARSN
mmetsp:Transcript_71942/g.168402  ORF Transcript_71942/g.168402 Transcript_71942/m.168402 type:complete len:261 (-) Transcript_71942:114-896(-)